MIPTHPKTLLGWLANLPTFLFVEGFHESLCKSAWHKDEIRTRPERHRKTRIVCSQHTSAFALEELCLGCVGPYSSAEAGAEVQVQTPNTSAATAFVRLMWAKLVYLAFAYLAAWLQKISYISCERGWVRDEDVSICHYDFAKFVKSRSLSSLKPPREGDLSGMLVSWPSAAASLPREQRGFDAKVWRQTCAVTGDGLRIDCFDSLRLKIESNIWNRFSMSSNDHSPVNVACPPWLQAHDSMKAREWQGVPDTRSHGATDPPYMLGSAYWHVYSIHL